MNSKTIKCFDILLEPVSGIYSSLEHYRLDNCFSLAQVINAAYHLDNVNRELSVVVGFTPGGRITGMHQVSSGDVGSTRVSPAQIFKFLLLTNSSSFIIAHNHPSGDGNPSAHDIHFTQKMLHASRLIGIEMLDHIIITRGGVLSLQKDTELWTK